MKKYLLLILWIGCQQSSFCQPFSNVALSIGIDDEYGSPSFFGGGISFCDFDNDGDDDLTFCTTSGSPIYFYENNNGTFTKIAPLVNASSLFSKKILWVDYDNDGDKDLFIAAYLGVNKLYQNMGGQSFVDVTSAVGLLPVSDPTFGATFGDINNDGWLDLYIINRANAGIHPCYLYLSDGQGGFQNITNSSGVDVMGIGSHFDAVFFDYNFDGKLDIHVVTDKDDEKNTMFKNIFQSSVKFTDVSVTTGTALFIDAMNNAVGDFDNDGDFDLYITNRPQSGGSFLMQNNFPVDNFTNVAGTNGAQFANRVGWGGSFFDYDNDLDLDLYVSAEELGSAKPNALYENDGTGNFTEPFPNGFSGDTIPSFCNTIGDFNNDGKLDIVVSHAASHKFHVWQNNSTAPNNFLKIKLEGTTSNKDGYGAIVEMYIGSNKYIRTKLCGEGYLGQTSDNIHFGMGTATVADSLTIRWLGGNTDTYYNVSANQTVFYMENAVSPLPLELTHFSGESMPNQTIQLHWRTQSEINFKGFEIQRSLSGLNFENLAFIEGKGNNLTKSNYTYLDENILEFDRYYYRLKMVDEDGSFQYSNIISFNPISDKTFVINNIFPNPINNYFYLDFSSKNNINTTLTLLNTNGMLIRRWNENLQKGHHQLEVDVNNLAPGNYFLIVSGKFTTKQLQFSISK